MAKRGLTGFFFCLLRVSALALSQTNELTIYRIPGTQINNEFGIRTACDENVRVCGHISGHRETFTIPAGTNIPKDTKEIRISKAEGAGAVIGVNDNPPTPGVLSLGGLTVKDDKVVTNAVFTADFLIKDTDPPLQLQDFKNETVVLLNGPMGNERVSIVLAANNDGSGSTFALNIHPGSTTSGTPGRTLENLFIAPVLPIGEDHVDGPALSAQTTMAFREKFVFQIPLEANQKDANEDHPDRAEQRDFIVMDNGRVLEILRNLPVEPHLHRLQNMTLTTYFCFVLSLSALALSQVNELTIHRNPGTRINNEFFTVEFVARAIREACDDTGRVCGHISGHRETFTIPADETVVLLNGPVGNEPVSITLAEKNDGSGDTFVLTVDPTGVPPAQLLHDLASHRDGNRNKFARNVQLRRAITNGSAAAALKDFCLAVLLIMLAKLFSEI
nr:unnamed protein product [Spirometra erinaceieuropaei]